MRHESRSLREQYQAQEIGHKHDPQTNLGVPVAFALYPEGGLDFAAFIRGMGELGGRAHPLKGFDERDAIVFKYKNRPTELWVRSTFPYYKEAYRAFCTEWLQVDLEDDFGPAGYEVDHAYCKSAILPDVDAYVRLFLVKRGANRSWGAYFEKKLKDEFRCRERVGLRKETVAIRAKISGIPAPKKGTGAERDEKNVEEVVDQLISKGMTDISTRSADVALLSAFCGVADGNTSGMTVTLRNDGSILVNRHWKTDRQ